MEQVQNKELSKEELIELLKQFDALSQAEKESVLEDMTFSRIQEEVLVALLNGEANVIGLCGGNQSGKSHLGAAACLIFMTGIIPKCILPRINPERFSRFRGEYLSLALDFTSSAGISQKKIFSLIPNRHITHFNKELRILSTPNNSTIMFKSMDSGWEKLAGFIFDGVWIDEEPRDKMIWDEASMRVATRQGWMLMTFSPLKGLTWAYSDLYKKAKKYITTRNVHGIKEDVGIVHSLDDIDKLKEREVVETINSDSDARDNILFFQMTQYDNTYLPSKSIQEKEQDHANNPLFYQARILGRFTKLIGREVFNIIKLQEMSAELNQKGFKYEVENNSLKAVINGRLTVYVDKKLGRQYVIGADIAEGLEAGNYSCAQVLDRISHEQVAIWHGHVSPEEFARILNDLGRFYNDALLAPERNFHGLGVINLLRDKFNYLNLYYSRDASDQVLSKLANISSKKRFGWLTNYKTKPIMIQTLADYLNNKKIKLNDKATIDELITYIYNEDGKTSAMGGCFDDRVTSLAIAVMALQKSFGKNKPVTRITYDKKISSIIGY